MPAPAIDPEENSYQQIPESSGPGVVAVDEEEAEKSQRWPSTEETADTAATDEEELDMEQPSRHVRTLGRFRFRPPDDDEPR